MMKRDPEPPTREKGTGHSPELPDWLGYLVGPVFLGAAAWFWWGSNGSNLPVTAATLVDRSKLTTAPRRAILLDPPLIEINGFKRTCMECHRTFPAREDEPKRFLQHADIILNHGINDHCRNCHYGDDHDRLILRDGGVIGYRQVNELCAQCHGPTWRDWLRGAHGRTNGYWDASRGPVKRLGCTECHDPHNPRAPAMDPLEPLPGPNTLRMGNPRNQDHLDPSVGRDPLRKHRVRGERSHGPLPRNGSNTDEEQDVSE